jgi:hypothetical protein
MGQYKSDILETRVDSREYEILTYAIKQIKNVEGLSCEIGVREGGSSYMIMKTLLENNDKKIHIGIDPFGNIDYSHWENKVGKCDYTNSMKQKTLQELYQWCNQHNQEFLFFPLEDTEFFKRYPDGVPVYEQNKYIVDKYASVFFDGPHTTVLIKEEIEFFKSRTPVGGVWIFDDIEQYPHMRNVDSLIRNLGFKQLQKGTKKISYQRTSL